MTKCHHTDLVFHVQLSQPLSLSIWSIHLLLTNFIPNFTGDKVQTDKGKNYRNRYRHKHRKQSPTGGLTQVQNLFIARWQS